MIFLTWDSIPLLSKLHSRMIFPNCDSIPLLSKFHSRMIFGSCEWLPPKKKSEEEYFGLFHREKASKRNELGVVPLFPCGSRISTNEEIFKSRSPTSPPVAETARRREYFEPGGWESGLECRVGALLFQETESFASSRFQDQSFPPYPRGQSHFWNTMKSLLKWHFITFHWIKFPSLLAICPNCQVGRTTY